MTRAQERARGRVKTVQKSEAWRVGRDAARAQVERLWAEGFRPRWACDVERGCEIAYFETDVFQLETVGDYHVARVHDVYDDGMGLISIAHSGALTQADECMEVWVR